MTAFAEAALGRLGRAAGLLRAALAIHRSESNDEGVVFVLVGYVMLAAGVGAWERALWFAGAAAALRERIGVNATPADLRLVDRALAPARRALGEAAAERAFASGRETAADTALAEAATAEDLAAGSQLGSERTEPFRTAPTVARAGGHGPLEPTVVEAAGAQPREPRGGAAAPGDILDERYRLEALLGRGGMGEVYRATDRRLGRSVAVKTLLAGVAGTPGILERFEREARVVARLRHPNVVAVHDFGRTPAGLLYIVMELLDGRSLRLELGCGPMAPERAVGLVRQACSGVAAAHRAGVVHRDLKPDNLFLAGEDDAAHVKVLDFGIAKLLGPDGGDEAPLTRSGAVMGTGYYMSPEQCEGRPADERSDVYSLGCILFEMIAGEPPFTAESFPALLHKHVYEEPRRPSEIAGDLPGGLEDAILRALGKNPSERFATAADLGRALAAIG